MNRFEQCLESQGNTNGCGTTSLAMLLNYWTGKPGEYHRARIDVDIRRGPDMFTSPLKIVEYARKEGFRAQAKNNASLKELTGYLDKGVPVQVLIDPDGDGTNASLHYVNVIDYEVQDGRVSKLKIANPAGGAIQAWSAAEFERKWSNLGFLHVPTGLNNIMLVTLPGKNQPVEGKDGQTYPSDEIALPDSSPGPLGAFGIDLTLGPQAWLADMFSNDLIMLAKLKDRAVATANGLWSRLTGR